MLAETPPACRATRDSQIDYEGFCIAAEPELSAQSTRLHISYAPRRRHHSPLAGRELHKNQRHTQAYISSVGATIQRHKTLDEGEGESCGAVCGRSRSRNTSAASTRVRRRQPNGGGASETDGAALWSALRLCCSPASDSQHFLPRFVHETPHTARSSRVLDFVQSSSFLFPFLSVVNSYYQRRHPLHARPRQANLFALAHLTLIFPRLFRVCETLNNNYCSRVDLEEKKKPVPGL
jgi:hypothetical protein